MIEVSFFVFSALLILGAAGVLFLRNPVHAVLSLIFCFFNAAGLILLTGAEFIAVILLIVYVGAVAVLFLFVMMMMNVSPYEQTSVVSRAKFMASVRHLGHLAVMSLLFLIAFCISVFLPPLFDALRSSIPMDLPSVIDAMVQSDWFIFSGQGELHKKILVLIPCLLLSWQLTSHVTGRAFLPILADFIDSTIFITMIGFIVTLFFVYFASTFTPFSFSEDFLDAQAPPEDLLTNTEALGQILYSPYALLFQGCGLILLVSMIGAIVLTFRKRHGVKRQDITSQVMRNPQETVSLRNIPLNKGLVGYE